jgi:putative FmdB family regulatory protein
VPIFDFHCKACGKDFESLSKPYEPVQCAHCRTPGAEKKISSFGGYQIQGDNSASVRPKGAGSRTG